MYPIDTSHKVMYTRIWENRYFWMVENFRAYDKIKIVYLGNLLYLISGTVQKSKRIS